MRFSKTVYIALVSVVLVIAGIITLFLLYPWPNQNQRTLSEIKKYSESCKSATLKAEEDFRANELRIIEWGLPDSERQNFQAKLLEERFKIKLIQGGCVASDEIDCYNDRMHTLIIDKFGIEPLNATIKDAQKLHELDRKKFN